MRNNLRRGLLITVIVFLLTAIFTVPVLAFDSRSGTNITIGSGETVNGDLYLTGTNVTIEGTVNGDVFILGQNININGLVNGGISVAGQTITVNGKVSTGARIAGQTIHIGGNIGRDLIAVGSDVMVDRAAVIGGDLNLACSTGIMNGHVAGNIRGSVNLLTIAGAVDGNVNITVSSLNITSSANIRGNLTYTSRNTVTIQSGSVIGGTTSQIIPANHRGRGIWAGVAGLIGLRIFGFLAIFIIGLVIIFLATRRIMQLATAVQRDPVQCLGWGALIFFATPVAAFIVMFTVIGIPLSILSLVIWGILLYLSQIPVALAIGWLILLRGRETRSRGFLVGALALGLFILYVVSLIPVVGWIFWLFVILFGLGTLVTVFRIIPKKVTEAPTT
jgi:hypothetical protein